MIFFSLTEAPLPDPTPTPPNTPKRTRNGPKTDPKRTRNGAKRSRNGAETEPKWTEIKRFGVGRAGVCRGRGGWGVVREKEYHYASSPYLFMLGCPPYLKNLGTANRPGVKDLEATDRPNMKGSAQGLFWQIFPKLALFMAFLPSLFVKFLDRERSDVPALSVAARNVVHVIGLTPNIAKAEVLKRNEFFGQCPAITCLLLPYQQEDIAAAKLIVSSPNL